jgi:hypothetical protein
VLAISKARRRRPRLDTTPTTVDVAPGHEVFWDGAQCSGRLHAVPRHLALHWQKQRWAVIVTEPVGVGAASNTENVDMQVQAAATTAVLSESDELRDTSTDLNTRGTTSSPGPVRTPGCSVKNGLYGFQKFWPETADAAVEIRNPLLDNASQDGEAREIASLSGGLELVLPVRSRTGSRRCPNCLSPVSGKRKWCSEACRLRAYRAAR